MSSGEGNLAAKESQLSVAKSDFIFAWIQDWPDETREKVLLESFSFEKGAQLLSLVFLILLKTLRVTFNFLSIYSSQGTFRDGDCRRTQQAVQAGQHAVVDANAERAARDHQPGSNHRRDKHHGGRAQKQQH